PLRRPPPPPPPPRARRRRKRTDTRSRRRDSRTGSHPRGNTCRQDSNKSKPAATTPRQSAHRWRRRRAPIPNPNPSGLPPVSSCSGRLRRRAERRSTLVSWLYLPCSLYFSRSVGGCRTMINSSACSAPENNAAEAAQSEREVNSADDRRGQNLRPYD